MTEEAAPEQVVEFMTNVMKAAPEEIIVLLRLEVERLRAAERKAPGTVVGELQAEVEQLRGLNDQLLVDCAKAETEIEQLRAGRDAYRAVAVERDAENVKLRAITTHAAGFLDGMAQRIDGWRRWDSGEGDVGSFVKAVEDCRAMAASLQRMLG